jgi:hypothetical protein
MVVASEFAEVDKEVARNNQDTAWLMERKAVVIEID